MYTIEERLFIVLIGFIVLVGGLIAYFIYAMVRQSDHYRKLQHNADRSRLEALEQERRLIAADLHDDIGPILSGTLYEMDEVDANSDRGKTALDNSKQKINSVFVRIKDLSSSLVPQAIERLGPLYALEDFIAVYLTDKKLQVHIEPVSCTGLSATRSLHLFRMLQEILHNTIRHAKASSLSVTGKLEGDKLTIQTADDGTGFDPYGLREHRGLGLQNLALRAKMIEAKMWINSSKGAGTQHTIELFITESK